MQAYTSKVQEINNVIEELFQVNSKEDCEEICKKLDNIYLTKDGKVDESFRHEYSSISGKIRELNSVEVKGEKVFQLDSLIYSIDNVYEYALAKNKPYIKNLFKLRDHISLEAGRILLVQQIQWEINNNKESVKEQLQYTQSLAESFDDQVRREKQLLDSLRTAADENNSQIEKSKETLDELQQTSDAMVDKIEGVQKDSITILGIFASIVFSFTAGMIFTSSVLENIDKASPYRLFGTVLLIGMVITNLVTLLLAYIDRIRMVKNTKITFPKSIKIMNGLYAVAFVADFVVWLIIEKMHWVC